MIELGVNIDHIATVRQARRTYEPDPVWAAVEAHLGGADGITVHLREDRRHIQDEDVRRLRELTHIKLNLEMAATDEMVGVALRVKPEMAMLVPEGRQEVTTEGGLDIAGQEARIREVIARLAGAGIVTSVFIDARAARRSRRPRAPAPASARCTPDPMRMRSMPRAAIRRPRRSWPSWRRSVPPGRRSAASACASTPGTRSTTSTSSPWRRSPGSPRTAHRPRDREPRRLRRHARGGARDEGADERGCCARPLLKAGAR